MEYGPSVVVSDDSPVVVDSPDVVPSDVPVVSDAEESGVTTAGAASEETPSENCAGALDDCTPRTSFVSVHVFRLT